MTTRSSANRERKPAPAAGWWCSVCRTMPVVANDRCGTCYRYRKRTGHDRPEHLARRQGRLNYERDQRRLAGEVQTVVEYLGERIEVHESGCWRWTGSITPKGYGLVLYRTQRALAHRVVYQWLVGVIPMRMTLDHTCHNADASCVGGPSCIHRRCVNPEHLAVATIGDNSRAAHRARGDWSMPA